MGDCPGTGWVRGGQMPHTTGDMQMPGPRPGSHAYEVKLARLRKEIENSGRAADQEANALANRIMQEDRGQEGILRSERGLGPKGEREPGEPK